MKLKNTLSRLINLYKIETEILVSIFFDNNYRKNEILLTPSY